MINNGVWVGRAGKDPEKFTFENSQKAVVTMACNRPTKDAKTDWFTVEVWGKQADILCQFVKKGHVFGAIGSVHIEEFQHNGQNKKKVVIAANQIRLMNPKDQGTQQPVAAGAAAGDVFAAFGQNTNEDLPF